MSQSGYVLPPSPVSGSCGLPIGSLLVTPVIWQDTASLQSSVASTVIVTGTIWWFGGHSRAGAGEERVGEGFFIWNTRDAAQDAHRFRKWSVNT